MWGRMWREGKAQRRLSYMLLNHRDRPIPIEMAGLDGQLAQLPSEIVLRIIDYLPVSSIVALTQTSRNWHLFIDQAHQDHIFHSKTEHPKASRDFSFLSELPSFSNYYDDVSSWKQLCKKQTLLGRNWTCDLPTTRESFVHVFRSAVWRFRPDFKNRWFMSTSVSGGIYVTDMDTGERLWSLSIGYVRPYAHLEYDKGWAAWDRWGNSIELWKAIESGEERGHFKQVAIIPHDCETRGFHLVYPTLCVVSTESQGFVYDLSRGIPQLQTKLNIETEAGGHLCQEERAVMYSIGRKGYHFHSKETGALLGVLEPKYCTTHVCHIRHPQPPPGYHKRSTEDPPRPPYTLGAPTQNRLVRLELSAGPHSRHTADYLSPEDDEWGAGLLSGRLMVGLSKSGRLIVCPDWPEAIRSKARAAALCTIIECETDPSSFHAGGWLSIKNHRVLFEVSDRLYILTLPGDGVPFVHQPQPIFATPLSASIWLNTPASWMGVFDDCIMSTYALYTRGSGTNRTEVDEDGIELFYRNRPQAAKVIRVMSFAPEV